MNWIDRHYQEYKGNASSNNIPTVIQLCSDASAYLVLNNSHRRRKIY
jgi:hypothetical protein